MVGSTRHSVNGILYQKLACTFVVVALQGLPWAVSKFGQSVRTTSEQQGFRFRERLGSKQESSQNAHPYNTYARGINTWDRLISWWFLNMIHHYPICFLWCDLLGCKLVKVGLADFLILLRLVPFDIEVDQVEVEPGLWGSCMMMSLDDSWWFLMLHSNLVQETSEANVVWHIQQWFPPLSQVFSVSWFRDLSLEIFPSQLIHGSTESSFHRNSRFFSRWLGRFLASLRCRRDWLNAFREVRSLSVYLKTTATFRRQEFWVRRT